MLRRCVLRLPSAYHHFCGRECVSLLMQKPICYHKSCRTTNIHFNDNSKRKIKNDAISESYVRNQYNNSQQKDNGNSSNNNNNNNNNDLESQIEKKINCIQSCIKEKSRVFANDVHQLVTYVKTAGVCSTENGVLLLQCCGDLIPNLHPDKKVELLFTVWEMLTNLSTKNGNSITNDHYYAYLLSLAENKCSVSVDDILKSMLDRGLMVDDRIYYALLRCTCEVGDMQQSTKLIVKLKDANIPTTHEVFDYIILGRARSRDMTSAESVIHLLESDLVKCEASTYTALLKGSAELGLSEKVDYYLKQANEISPLSSSQILDIVKSLANGNLLHFIPIVLKAGDWVDEVDNRLVNTCIQLIHLGFIDAALSMFTTLPQCMPLSLDSLPSQCSFFLQELISSNAPAQKIIEVCNALLNINEYALSKATELALLSKHVELALELLKEMYSQGFPVRPHYFWPLVLSASKDHGEQGLMRILDAMLSMNVRPDFETLFDYMFPLCDFSDPVATMNKFRNYGLTLVELMTPTVAVLLDLLRINDAIQLCKNFKTRLDSSFLAYHIALAYVQKANINQLMTLLSLVKSETTTGTVIQHVLMQKQFPVKSEKIITLLKTLKDANYSVKKGVYDTIVKCQSQYGIPKDIIPPVDISDALSPVNMKSPKDMDVEGLECHLLELKAKSLNTRGVLRRLLQVHCRFGNTDRAMEIHQELRAGGFQFSAGMLSSLLQVYTLAGKAHEAEKCLAELQTKHRDFEIDGFKVLDLATLLTANGKYDRAEKLIKDTAVKTGPLEGNTRNCVNLLLSIAENENPAATKRMFNLLINRYSHLSNIVLGPLVRSYIIKDDVDGAVKEFENCFKTYKKTPLAYELMMNLATVAVKDESKSKQLERVLEICREAHTPRNANVMFLVALAECNCEKQLLTLLHTPGFKLHSETLMRRCKRLVVENKPAALLMLMLALKQMIPLQDVQCLCNMILVAYDQQGDCDGALVLWSQVQEHDIVIPDDFKKKLAKLLINHKRTVPFKM